MALGTYSIGVGDRFAHQAKAQLDACLLAAKAGAEVIPVWNKSNREHTIIGSEPASARVAAEAAVVARGWKLPWFCDADHINLRSIASLFRAIFLPSTWPTTSENQPTPTRSIAL